MKRKSKLKPSIIPVCYLESGSNLIKWGNAVRVEGKRKPIVRFDDGGWNYGVDCFFSEEQCRHYNHIPPKDWMDNNSAIAEKLEKLVESLREQ